MILRLASVIGVIAVLSGGVLYAAPAGPPASDGVAYFYDALDPDGDWLFVEPYGWVWTPDRVSPFWRPYTAGRWEWTDWGWTWISSEPWGWATYHYGRWVRPDRHGWVWIPGDVWGPAWVAWRYGPGVVGWAPLPPEIRFRAGVGLDWGGIDVDVAIRLDHWCFVDDWRFANVDVLRWTYPVGRNTSVIRATRQATRFRVDGERIVNEGIDRGELERRTHRPIPVRRIVDNPRSGRRSAEIRTEELRVFRPAVRPGPPDADPPRGRRPLDSARRPEREPVVVEAERRWDRAWGKDWDKLQKQQRRDEPDAALPSARMRPEVLQKVRDENMDAAENAHRELVAERERALREDERRPKKAGPRKR